VGGFKSNAMQFNFSFTTQEGQVLALRSDKWVAVKADQPVNLRVRGHVWTDVVQVTDADGKVLYKAWYY
jgi:hypothetical protein